jgi:predicted small lipoprotein YifL
MFKTGLRWVLGALLVMGLSGCGQMGPLVMPPEEEPVTTSQTSPEATPAPAGSEAPSK